jgi:hypothetical protein
MESKNHTQDWLFPENLGKRLSIDEIALIGELYTILTNKAAKEERNHSSYDCWN